MMKKHAKFKWLFVLCLIGLVFIVGCSRSIVTTDELRVLGETIAIEGGLSNKTWMDFKLKVSQENNIDITKIVLINATKFPSKRGTPVMVKFKIGNEEFYYENGVTQKIFNEKDLD